MVSAQSADEIHLDGRREAPHINAPMYLPASLQVRHMHYSQRVTRN